MRKHLRIAIGSTLLLSATPVSGQEIRDHPRVQQAVRLIEVWLDAQRDYEEIPGLSASVVYDQESVWSGAFGYADFERRTPASPNTIYSVCSISKLFTSIAVMQLRDAGKLRLDDPVSAHLSWFDIQRTRPDAPEVTIEGLLTHSSGLPRETSHSYWTGPDFPFPTRDEVIEGLASQETLYPARAYFQYSNLGLTLAGEIVEQLSGVPYGDYVRSNVLDPLGMASTYPEIPEEHRDGRFATGFSASTRKGVREPVAFFQAKGIAPAAGYASTAEDLARFASWQFRLTGDAKEVLHAHTLDEMQRVHYVDPAFQTFWGLGFAVERRADKTFVGHGGACPGFRSHVSLQTDEKVATVFMANAMVNAGKFTNGMYDLVAAAIETAAGEESDAATDEPTGAAKGAGPDLGAYVGTYSAQPWGAETAVVRWKGGLALLSLPTDNPSNALTRLRHDRDDVFYRVRPDDERGEDLIFQRDESGRVVSFSQHGNFSPRIR